LKSAEFEKFLKANSYIKRLELSNWGEAFLNPELLQMFECADRLGVELAIWNGANLNTAKLDVLEGLVKYKVAAVSVSIDGATQETYEKYRVNGNLENVLANIRTINRFKAQYDSKLPELLWQFVIFGHNEHEVERAREMALELDMNFVPKLNWEDMYDLPFSPVEDPEIARRECGAASRAEFQEKFKRPFCQPICQELWTRPQVNFDGEVLGCCVNHWQSFGNAFQQDFLEIVNGERMNYARAMLTGSAKERDDIPCSSCKIYEQMKLRQTWLKESDFLPVAKASTQ
jgi:MoaA/NifB/PqqE/SkfB family radical SAM enzyme